MLQRETHRQFIATYIMASGRNGTLYTGMASYLPRRVLQHKRGDLEGFTADYRCRTLVWYETSQSVIAAIKREKQIKHWLRKWKLDLIEKENPEWRDLSDGWFEH